MEWNLTDLYESIESERIKKDFIKLEKNSLSFAKKYQNKINDKVTPNVINSALVDLEKIYEGLGKISSYASLLFASDTNNEKVSIMIKFDYSIKTHNWCIFCVFNNQK